MVNYLLQFQYQLDSLTNWPASLFMNLCHIYHLPSCLFVCSINNHHFALSAAVYLGPLATLNNVHSLHEC